MIASVQRAGLREQGRRTYHRLMKRKRYTERPGRYCILRTSYSEPRRHARPIPLNLGLPTPFLSHHLSGRLPQTEVTPGAHIEPLLPDHQHPRMRSGPTTQKITSRASSQRRRCFAHCCSISIFHQPETVLGYHACRSTFLRINAFTTVSKI